MWSKSKEKHSLDTAQQLFENSENNELSNNGAYIYVHTEDDNITITQDYIGSYGLYYYQQDNYFAISNSFLNPAQISPFQRSSLLLQD